MLARRQALELARAARPDALQLTVPIGGVSSAAARLLVPQPLSAPPATGSTGGFDDFDFGDDLGGDDFGGGDFGGGDFGGGDFGGSGGGGDVNNFDDDDADGGAAQQAAASGAAVVPVVAFGAPSTLPLVEALRHSSVMKMLESRQFHQSFWSARGSNSQIAAPTTMQNRARGGRAALLAYVSWLTTEHGASVETGALPDDWHGVSRLHCSEVVRILIGLYRTWATTRTRPGGLAFFGIAARNDARIDAVVRERFKLTKSSAIAGLKMFACIVDWLKSNLSHDAGREDGGVIRQVALSVSALACVFFFVIVCKSHPNGLCVWDSRRTCASGSTIWRSTLAKRKACSAHGQAEASASRRSPQSRARATSRTRQSSPSAHCSAI